jgi:hypothetical protein
MAFALMLAFQAAAQPPLPIDFDLARVRPIDSDLGRLPGNCRRGPDEEVVVCGSRPRGEYPYAEMERLFRIRPIRAEMRIGSMTGRAYVEQAAGDRGAVSNRVMFGIRLPF